MKEGSVLEDGEKYERNLIKTKKWERKLVYHESSNISLTLSILPRSLKFIKDFILNPNFLPSEFLDNMRLKTIVAALS